MKKVLILVCFLILMSGIGIVSAESASGTLGSTGLNSTQYNFAEVSSTAAAPAKMRSANFQLTGGTTALIIFPTRIFSFTSTAPSGATTLFNLTVAGTGEIGNGTMGYQRVYATNGTEVPGYIWFQFDAYSTMGLSGAQQPVLNYNSSALYGVVVGGVQAGVDAPIGGLSLTHASAMIAGSYVWNRDTSVSADYAAEKYESLGRINGTVTKTFGTSQAYIIDGVSNLPLISDPTITTDTLTFDVFAQSIKVAVWDGATWYNSSVLFSAPVTPTPTVTPTTAPTIAPGYVRTNVWVMDHLGNGVHGVDIAMYDIEGTTWSNSTGDADARHYIDTLPYHTLNLYADLTAFPDEFLPASLLGVETGYSGESYYLVMYPTTLPPGDGNVNLYVTVTDEDTGFLIRDAALTATYGTTTQGGTSGSTGTEIFVVPNQTNIRITGSKAGYTSATQYLNSGTGTVINTGLELTKLLVTTVPTGTIPPGGLTIPPTVNPHDPSITGNTNAAAQDMMNYLAANGMQLVQLCFLVTILGLLGIKLGK